MDVAPWACPVGFGSVVVALVLTYVVTALRTVVQGVTKLLDSGRERVRGDSNVDFEARGGRFGMGAGCRTITFDVQPRLPSMEYTHRLDLTAVR